MTTNPVSQTVTAGQSVTFTAAATGTPTPTVQWQVSNNGGAAYANISGATAATYTFTMTRRPDGQPVPGRLYQHRRHGDHESGHADLRHTAGRDDQPASASRSPPASGHAFGRRCGQSHASRAVAGEHQRQV